MDIFEGAIIGLASSDRSRVVGPLEVQGELARVSPPGLADELHFPRTTDGWRIALHRYRPRAAIERSSVILCGGYACNRYFLDYDERFSLARFLARTGFDAWVVELRGRGLSHPDPELAPSANWTFDDLVHFDAPTTIDHVASITGRPVVWVGHSLGGLLLYAYLARNADRDHLVSAGVTLASPVVFPAVNSALLRQLGPRFLALPFSDVIHQRFFVSVIWALVGSSFWPLGDGLALRLGMNPDNVDRQMVARAMRLVTEDIPRAKLQQLAHWAIDGVFCSVDGQFDYRAGLADVRVPMLVAAGSADRMAPPSAVQCALDHLAPERTEYLEFGRAHGYSADYGHVDLILGRSAPIEVFPAVARWIARQAR